MTIQIKVSPDRIDASAFAGGEVNPGHGAQIVFFGVVRKENHGRHVLAVAYDAFAPLAETVLREICTEAAEKFGGGLDFCVTHRTGKLAVGEISLGIAVSSKHRDEAYQASRFVIEELKTRAPLWKKEFYEDGESQWLRGHALCGEGQAKNPPLSSNTSS